MVWGVLLVISYDFLRIFRRVISHGFVVIAIEDVLFWMIWALIIFGLLYKYDDGAVRSYAVAGMALGVLVYGIMISRWLVAYISRGLLWIKRKIVNSCAKLLKIIRKPVTIIKYRIIRPKREKDRMD